MSIESMIHYPQISDWNQTALVEETINDNLFDAVGRPPLHKLQHGAQVLESALTEKRFDAEVISLQLQRIMPWVLFNVKEKKWSYAGLLNIDGAWAQIISLVKDRPDPISIDALVSEFENNLVAPVKDLRVMLGDVENLIESSESTRVKVLKERMKRTLPNHEKAISWPNWVMFNRAKKHVELLSLFESESAKHASVEKSLQGLIDDRNNFWRTYFKKGLVQDCWLVVSESKSKSLDAKYKNILISEEYKDSELGIILSIGGTIFLEWAKPNGIAISPSSIDITLLERDIDKLVLSKKIFAHSFSSLGYWQHITAVFLRKRTGYMPKRADYK
ncbi:hypothetical protein L4D76_19485 [Photobacterium sagamiensis]|uniref:hypothetical protein n=1 Tax=Photobacterium sagamiensis TaxID=2910241 RepID=UPI003D125BFC